ncbi:MAG: S8 family serine peptidase, partial [Candidatus Limnocylindrales bacterium]
MNGAKLNRFRISVVIGFVLALALPASVAAGGLVLVDGSAAGLDAPPNTTSWIVTFKPGVDTSHSSTFAKNAGGRSGQVFKHAIHGFVFHGDATEAAALKKNPFIRTIVPNGKIAIATDPIQTGVSRIRANHLGGDSAFAAGFTGQGVKVAVLDTGVDLTHPDLVPNLDIALGKNCITTGPPQDGHGHGTHVAGIIAAADNGVGVIGVAPKATIVPIKVLDDTGNGEWSNLICAVDYLTGLMTDGDPTNDVRVANMSLGDVGGIGTCTDGSIREAICKSVAAGVTYVAAAGNSTVDASTFIPAAFPEVIAVSALTDLDGEPGGQGGCLIDFLSYYCDDTLAEFSNFGSTIAVAAPGVQIYSDWTGGGYATEDGTSMASPHVAGVAALALQAKPTLTPADIRYVLTATGECPDGTFADTNGHGDCTGEGQWGNDPDGIAEPLVNALHAVQGATGDRLPTVSITSPANGATVTGPVAITANATDDHGITKVDFSVNGALIATDTNGTDGWSANWDASAVDQGSYSIAAKATDTAGQTSTNRITVVRPTNLQGSWVGKYGSDGYILGNWNGNNSDLASLPAGVTYSLTQGARATWVSPTTDVRALTDPAGVQRRSQTFYDLSQLQVKLSFTNAYSGLLHLYAVDWDAYGGNRYQTVTVDDGSGPRAVGLTSSFQAGAWIHMPIAVAAGGSVVVTVSKTGGYSAVLAGLFLGGGGTPPPPPTVPGAPTGLTATAGIGQVALAWTAPASNGGSPITGYTATASPGGATCASATLGCTITGLTGGTPYSFTVTATNAVGTGPASSPVSATPQAPVSLPVDSPGVQGTWVGNYGHDGYVLADWNGANTDLTSLPTGVTFGLDKGARYTWAGSTTDVRALSGPSGSGRQSQTWYDGAQMQVHLTFANAYSGTLHLYAVDWDAYNGNRYENITIDDGSGPQVAHLSSSFIPGAWVHIPISVPAGGTVHITVDKTAGESAVLAGLFLGGATSPPPSLPVDSPGVQGTWVGNYGHDGYILANWNGNSTDLSNLPAGVTYALELGARATWVSPTTDVRALTDPAGVERRSQTFYAADELRVRLTFANAYSGTLHLYAVDWDAYQGNRYENITIDDGSGPRMATLSSSFVPGAWIHVPITVGAGGSVSVTVDRTAGNSAVLAGLFLGGGNTPPPPPTAPGAPTGLTATAGNGQVALAWTAPASNGGSAITGYTVTGSPGGTCTSATLGCTVTGLTNGTAYSFTVTATNSVGTGPPSASASATPATVPGAPTGLTATAGNGQVALAWTAPASTGGSAITGYTVTGSPGGTCTSATLGCTVTGLTNGTSYTFTVTATNGVGTGPASSPAGATPATVPGAPTGLIATAGNAQVALTWTAPASNGGSAITGYTVTGSPGGTCSS